MKKSERIAELISFAETTINKYEMMPETFFNRGIIKNTKEQIAELQMTENKRGGANRNQGRKPKFDEETVMACFRVPKSKADEIKEQVYEIIDKYKTPKNEN